MFEIMTLLPSTPVFRDSLCRLALSATSSRPSGIGFPISRLSNRDLARRSLSVPSFGPLSPLLKEQRRKLQNCKPDIAKSASLGRNSSPPTSSLSRTETTLASPASSRLGRSHRGRGKRSDIQPRPPRYSLEKKLIVLFFVASGFYGTDTPAASLDHQRVSLRAVSAS